MLVMPLDSVIFVEPETPNQIDKLSPVAPRPLFALFDG